MLKSLRTLFKPFNLVLALGVASGGLRLEAQSTTVNVLYRFSGNNNINPYYGLTQLPNGALYGTCTGIEGDGQPAGCIFQINPDGTGFSVVHAFSPTSSESAFNAAGANPLDGPVYANGLFYGVTYQGGSGAYGVLYSVATNGANYTVLSQFGSSSYNLNTDVEYQYSGIALGGDGYLYGAGGCNGINSWDSQIYKISTNATGYANLHYFTTSAGGGAFNTLTTGRNGNLYGATDGDPYDDASDLGTVFTLTPAGGYTDLHDFTGTDGQQPAGGVIETTNGLLYGTASAGGTYSYGTAYRIGTNGSGFTVLHQFGNGKDGWYPYGKLLLASDGNLYGACLQGGTNGYGTIFRMATNGSNYQVLYSFTGTFTATGDHGYPNGCLFQASNGLIYGMTSDIDYNYDPAKGDGIIFVLNAGISTSSGTGVQAINRLSLSPTNLSSVQWSVTFGAAVTGVATTNFQLVATGLTGSPAITSVTGTGTNWTVTASTGAGTGTLQLNLTNIGGISPALTNTLPYTGSSYSIDLVAPTITIGAPSLSLVTTNSVSYAVTYADANFNTSTLAANNITVNATGTAQAASVVVTGSGTSYTVTLAGITGQGTLGISIAAGTASDTAGNLAPAAGPSAAFTVDLTPAITVQPAPQSAPALGSATFSVTASGTTPLFYQWSQAGGAISGATSASLTLTNLNRASVGYYSVTVSNAVGLVTSTNALLRVLIPQKFGQVLQPANSFSPTFQTLFRDTNDTVATLWYATNFFQVLGSTNLPTDWEPVSGTMSLTNGWILFQDNDPTNPLYHPYRFYSIKEQ